MRIVAVVITFNRPKLLHRALKSIANQLRLPDFVYVVSNSGEEFYSAEKEITDRLNYRWIVNHRTGNYPGALNTAIEELVKEFGIHDDLYFASLDDDDIWLPNYLSEIVNNNQENKDLLVAHYLRSSEKEDLLMVLPENLSERDFLRGNPGIGGSNTFIRLKTLLKAGCFDEAFESAVDRDFFVRVFLQKPSYKIIREHLVTAFTDSERYRLTSDRTKKIKSYKLFLHKWEHLMAEEDRESFFQRANDFFSIVKEDLVFERRDSPFHKKVELTFEQKGPYSFVIGFIAGNPSVSARIATEIVKKKVAVDLIVIIEDISVDETLNEMVSTLEAAKVPFKVISDKEWRSNLHTGYYGDYFKRFSGINSIPLGRTILHHHLYTETQTLKNPVIWIIDDDICLESMVSGELSDGTPDVFKIINQNIHHADAIIGGISNDPPIPTLFCIRAQLVDYFHSKISSQNGTGDPFSIHQLPDYYHDLTDLHSDHLEVPIYHQMLEEQEIDNLFSGKAISRPALQKGLSLGKGIVTRRGANTLVFNRDLLHYYPVINLEVNGKHARRGDLTWALFHQIVSNKVIYEHSFSVIHNRPKSKFDLSKELNKAAYDIVGYAFTKALFTVLYEIKNTVKPNRQKHALEKLLRENYFNLLRKEFDYRLLKRKSKFLMNYYRIIGLTELISNTSRRAIGYARELGDESQLTRFESILADARNENTLKEFVNELSDTIWSFSKSITEVAEADSDYTDLLFGHFSLEGVLNKLGAGAEGVVFSDGSFVYKCFYNILDTEWTFLKTISSQFSKSSLLEEIEFFESHGKRFIRYPFREFTKVRSIEARELVEFLRFCKENQLVYTNIKRENFIRTKSGELRLIDYGKSFEPFQQDKYINSVKRAFLLWKYPDMDDKTFRSITSLINRNEEPEEISGWNRLLWATVPRKKEQILDALVVPKIVHLMPQTILDYGCGKCKTALQLKEATTAQVFAYDIDTKTVRSRCKGLPEYDPTSKSHHGSFDVALLNLVLCEVDNSTFSEILQNVRLALKPAGHLIASVCNPDFADIRRTEFQCRDTVPVDKNLEETITKTCVYTGNHRSEYHRGTSWYVDQFTREGFEVLEQMDTEGVDLNSLNPASDFKILVLRKNDA